MQRSINEHQPTVEPGQFLVERMQPAPIAELMIGIRTDAQFGMVLTLAAGGTFAELMADAATLLLPATTRDIRSAIEKLKLARLLQGYRGGRAVDLDMLCRFVQGLCDYVVANRERIAELEINPLFVYEDRVMIVDVLMLEGRDQDGATLNAPKPIA
jgi:succinyl-CoA synthetase beta subunit